MNDHIFRALREKPFLLLWLGQIFTQISVNLFNFLLLLIVFSLTKSNTAVSGVVLAYTIPAIIFGVFAGVYVDRWPKKKVLYASNFVRAGLLLLLAYFDNSLFMIYAISFFISIATQFFIPAEAPMIPLTISKHYLYSANALFGMGLYGSILVAYILSGPLLLHLGPTNTILFVSLLLLIGAIFIFLIPLSGRDTHALKSQEAKSRPNMKREILHAFAFMTQNKIVRDSVILLSLSQILILVISVLAPGYASTVLGIQIEDFPLLFVVPAALGVVFGGILLINVFPKISKSKIATVGLLLTGLTLLILPNGQAIIGSQLAQHLRILPYILTLNTSYVIMSIAFIMGFANALIFVPSNTTLQEHTADNMRGKIYGTMNTLIGIFSLLPVLVAGGLSDIIGVGKVIGGIGAAVLLLGIFKVFTDK
jgi:MFS family permease